MLAGYSLDGFADVPVEVVCLPSTGQVMPLALCCCRCWCCCVVIIDVSGVVEADGADVVVVVALLFALSLLVELVGLPCLFVLRVLFVVALRC